MGGGVRAPLAKKRRSTLPCQPLNATFVRAVSGGVGLVNFLSNQYVHWRSSYSGVTMRVVSDGQSLGAPSKK